MSVQSTGHGKADGDGPYLPTKKVCTRYNITDRTLDRWLANSTLNFPRPMIVNKRRFFSEPLLIRWERTRVGKTAAA